MEMLVHVPHVPHTMWEGNECHCYYCQYGQVEIPWWCFLGWAIIVLVIFKVVIYIDGKINKDD